MLRTCSSLDMQQTPINLKEDLHKEAKWYLEHQLIINPDKTKCLLSVPCRCYRIHPMSLNFLRKIIKPILSVKVMGFRFDSYVSYDDHTSKLVSSCVSELCQINSLMGSFDNETLLLVIETLVINKLLYCPTVWSNTSSKNIKKPQAVQNFACRIITHTKKFDHVTPANFIARWKRKFYGTL